jgi:hypothetical protein
VGQMGGEDGVLQAHIRSLQLQEEKLKACRQQLSAEACFAACLAALADLVRCAKGGSEALVSIRWLRRVCVPPYTTDQCLRR